ncbi:hypothetical protein Efla_004789 [Eimeria flavescens]
MRMAGICQTVQGQSARRLDTAASHCSASSSETLSHRTASSSRSFNSSSNSSSSPALESRLSPAAPSSPADKNPSPEEACKKAAACPALRPPYRQRLNAAARHILPPASLQDLRLLLLQMKSQQKMVPMGQNAGFPKGNMHLDLRLVAPPPRRVQLAAVFPAKLEWTGGAEFATGAHCKFI